MNLSKTKNTKKQKQMDIVKLITDKTQELSDNGKLAEIVEKHVLRCVDDIVKDSFTWNGEGKKMLEKAIQDKLAIPIENIKIPQYNKIISNIVETNLNKSINEDALKNIQDTISKVTGTLDKKEFKLSEIISEFVNDLDKSYDGDMDDQCGELTLHVQGDKDFLHVYFDKESDKANYECENKLFIHKGKLTSVTIEGVPLSPFSIGKKYGFDQFIFTLYASNVTVINDESDVETDYYREDYD